MTQLLDATEQRVYPTDEELLHRVLTPYRAKRCEYLTSATVVLKDEHEDARLSADCTFLIPESCYIDDTGHFNSVEFNICFNQMAYYLVAKAVKESLIEPFSRWSLEQFWDRQLGDIFITDFKSSFRSAMSGRHFRGRIEIADIADWDGNDLRDALVMLRTGATYWTSRAVRATARSAPPSPIRPRTEPARLRGGSDDEQYGTPWASRGSTAGRHRTHIWPAGRPRPAVRPRLPEPARRVVARRGGLRRSRTGRRVRR